MLRRHLTYDSLLLLKDAGLVDTSAAAQVGGVDRILDLGSGLAKAAALLDVTAIEIDCDLPAQGTLTIDANVTAGDTMTIGTKLYTFDANGGLQNVDGHIEIGLNLAGTQANIANAINRTGAPGTGYAAAMTIHPTVASAAFAAEAAVLTAKTNGTAGDAIVTVETFTAGTNVFDGVTLGTTQAGRDNDELYEISLQGSNAANFASGIVDLAVVPLGANEVINADADTGTGRVLVEFSNEFMGTIYRYLRAYTRVAGTGITTGIHYTARISRDG